VFLLLAVRRSFKSSNFSRERGGVFVLGGPPPNAQQGEALSPLNCECSWPRSEAHMRPEGLTPSGPEVTLESDIPVLHLSQGTSRSPGRLTPEATERHIARGSPHYSV